MPVKLRIASTDPRLQPGAYVTDGARLFQTLAELPNDRYAFEDSAQPEDPAVILTREQVDEFLTIVKPV